MLQNNESKNNLGFTEWPPEAYLFWDSENRELQVDNSGWDIGTAWTHMPLSFCLPLLEAKWKFVSGYKTIHTT